MPNFLKSICVNLRRNVSFRFKITIESMWALYVYFKSNDEHKEVI